MREVPAVEVGTRKIVWVQIAVQEPAADPHHPTRAVRGKVLVRIGRDPRKWVEMTTVQAREWAALVMQAANESDLPNQIGDWSEPE